MLKSAQENLESSLKVNDLTGAKLAQSMLLNASQNREKERNHLELIGSLKKKRDKLCGFIN